jgi:hypothetical protein
MQTVMDHLDEQPAGAPPPVQVRDKRGEFLKGRPPVFTYVSEPIEANDWLRAVEKQLNIVQCNDPEKVLYFSAALPVVGLIVHPVVTGQLSRRAAVPRRNR